MVKKYEARHKSPNPKRKLHKWEKEDSAGIKEGNEIYEKVLKKRGVEGLLSKEGQTELKNKQKKARDSRTLRRMLESLDPKEGEDI